MSNAGHGWVHGMHGMTMRPNGVSLGHIHVGRDISNATVTLAALPGLKLIYSRKPSRGAAMLTAVVACPFLAAAQ